MKGYVRSDTHVSLLAKAGRLGGVVLAAALGTALFAPGAAQAQSLGCQSVNDGSINFTARFVAGDPRQSETTSRTATSTAALSVIAAAAGYSDNISTNMVPGINPFTPGDRLDFTAVVSQYSGSAGMRIRFRVNNSYVGLPAGARVTPDPTGTGTFTGYYNVPSGLQGVGMTVDHLGSTSNSLTDVTVTCTPYIDSNLSLGVTMTHSGTPQQGGTVDYTITPSASGANTGTNVTLTFSLPSGLSYNSGSGSGWSCTSTRCLYTNTIANGASGNPLTLRLNIASNAATSLTPSVTLSGGNAGSSASASDPTSIAVVQIPASVAIATGANQTASTNTVFATPLSVTVRDGSNAVIPNTSVTFTAPASGASGTFSNGSNSITVTTDGSGIANAGSFTANGSGGAYSVNATAGSVFATFSLTNNLVTVPSVTGLSPTTGPTGGGTTVVITGTGLAGATGVSFGGTAAAGFTVDSATQITATSPAASAGTVNVTVTTPSGTSSTGASNQFTYAVPPTTPTLTSTPATLTNSTSATFQFSLASGTGECSIDGGAFTSCTSPRTYTGLSDGSHSFQVRATSGGGTSAAASYSWTVDTTAPSAPIVTTPANASERVVTNRATSGTSEANATITVYLDGSADGTTTADGSGNWTYTLTALSAAAHTIKARATDAAGNTSVDSSTRSFTAYSELAVTQVSTSITATMNTTSFSATRPVTASGGKAPLAYAISGGTLPTGVTFDTSNGGLNGTPTSVLAATDFTITVTDSIGQASSKIVRLAVNSDRGQIVAFTSTAPGSARVGGTTYTVTAGSSSGLTVALTIDSASSGVCSISGSTVSFLGVGTCTINANQAGNGSYDPAPQVQQSFAVAQGTQSISFTSTAPSAAVAGGASYTPAATATSGLAVAFTIDPSSSAVCAISGGAVSFTGVGSCRVNANQAGNTDYTAAPQVQQSFAVGRGSQTIIFSALPDVAITASPVTLNATAGSGLPVSFTSSTGTICTVSGTSVTLAAQGLCTIVADQGGDASWNAAPAVTRSFTVRPPTLTISGGSPATAKVGATFSQTSTATGGVAPYSFAVTSGTLPAGLILDTATGVVSGTPTAIGSYNYAITVTDSASPAATATTSVVSGSIAKGDQSLSFTSSPPVPAPVGGVGYAVTATSSVGLTPSFAIDAASAGVCTISGSTVSFTGAGTCTVVASQAGDANYNAATAITQTITVAAAPVAGGRSGVVVPFASTGTAIDLAASIGGGGHTAIAIATAPAHGSASVAGDVVTYTPASGYFGSDSFTYTATGPGGTSAPGTVTLTVSTPAAPTAANASADVAYGSTGQAIPLAPSGVFTTLAIGTAPTKGAVTIAGTTATYVPTAGAFGA
ncbi:beta strand repeat-containing protein, partial [Sphingomonas elodea]|uniref:beta strand repeat-containing protein n=2 Tax=Pseudomonadota TaxID=1224 RepID=UPI0002630591